MAIDDDLPLWLENAGNVYHARFYRQFAAALTGHRTGVFRVGDLRVVQRGAGANMSVDVPFGSAMILHDDGSSFSNGSYFVQNGGTVNLPIAAADVTNDRHDLVVIDVRDSEISGLDDDARLRIVQGTAADSPVDPTTPDNAVVLARVLVNNGATSILDADIADRRVTLGHTQVDPEQVALSGGPTSGTTELTLGTINLAARQVPYTLECAAHWSGIHTAGGDDWRFRIRVDGTQKASVTRRDAGGANTRILFAIPSSTTVVIAANTAAVVTATIQRFGGTGTIDTTETGLLTARMYFGG